MFLHMKIRWILVAALFLLFAGLFAWEKGWLPFDPLQADTPITSGQSPADQAASADGAEDSANASKAQGTEAASQTNIAEGDGKTGADLTQTAGPDAANSDEEPAAPGEEVVKGTVEKGDLLIAAHIAAAGLRQHGFITARQILVKHPGDAEQFLLLFPDQRLLCPQRDEQAGRQHRQRAQQNGQQ